jgi:hypothetical protein
MNFDDFALFAQCAKSQKITVASMAAGARRKILSNDLTAKKEEEQSVPARQDRRSLAAHQSGVSKPGDHIQTPIFSSFTRPPYEEMVPAPSRGRMSEDE